jgi:hypothetical protein
METFEELRKSVDSSLFAVELEQTLRDVQNKEIGVIREAEDLIPTLQTAIKNTAEAIALLTRFQSLDRPLTRDEMEFFRQMSAMAQRLMAFYVKTLRATTEFKNITSREGRDVN